MSQLDQTEALKRIHAIIDHMRGPLLDDVELELGDSPRWPFVRSRLLKYFGDRGLEGQIAEVIRECSLTGAPHE